MTAPGYGALIRVFGRIGCLSFGGPAAQIALMHRELVEDAGWLSERDFLRALSFCMLLPGPEAMQLATYAGWRLKGVPGGLLAGGLFVLPGALVIAALALGYAALAGTAVAQAALVGIKAAVIAIVIQALIRLSGKAAATRWQALVAVAAFLALFALHLPFPLVLLGAGLTGALLAAPGAGKPGPLPLAHALPTLGLGAMLWLAPLGLTAALGVEFLTDLGQFFAKLAILSFGGAYALLAWMTQEIVGVHGWLTTAQMIDALGLAETTPGPLILVTQFVAMIAGAAEGGTGLALLAGALTLWMIFVPCFVFIFAGAPLIEALEGRPRLSGALSGITAAVLGVIASLSAWFSLNVLFGTVAETVFGPVRFPLPAPASLDLVALALTILATALLFRGRLPLWALVPAMGLLGIAAGAF